MNDFSLLGELHPFTKHVIRELRKKADTDYVGREIDKVLRRGKLWLGIKKSGRLAFFEFRKNGQKEPNWWFKKDAKKGFPKKLQNLMKVHGDRITTARAADGAQVFVDKKRLADALRAAE